MSGQTKQRLTLAAFGSALAIAVTIIGGVWAFGGEKAVALQAIYEHSRQLSDHETRIREVERTQERLARIEEKVDAIKDSIRRFESGGR